MHGPCMANCALVSKDNSKKRKMHTKSDNLQIVIGSNTDEILQKLLVLHSCSYKSASKFIFVYKNTKEIQEKTKVKNTIRF